MKILVIADIHGNAEALRAVLKKDGDADRTIFLGDAVLPGPQANETIELMKGMPQGINILGNHDYELLDSSMLLLDGWPPHWLAYSKWIREHLDPAGYDYVKTFHPEGEFEEDGIRMLLRHGFLPGGVRHLVPDTPDEKFIELANGSSCKYVLFGHSHIQFRRMVNGQEFINPGSVGQNRCGRNAACYGLIEDGIFRHCQISYDNQGWLDAIDRIPPLQEFPDFLQRQKDGMITGFGIGEHEPWARFSQEGYW
ncbi:MAG: metallophosphoesterase [OM182 bacterium]|uniref:Metallophosphoesterase n=1 Tax=OM182 bacterium TaxID=2510334 RepID=A0A520S4F9_9GAMM|nr:MAG: metallophosphoesterase [OM182 bacterium]